MESDIPAALRLSTQAGWNQLEADWRRLLRLFPGQCLAGCIQGHVVATGTLATYGKQLGWVGMILVDEAHRRCGYGTAMLDAAIALGESIGIERLGLDATDFGRPLYEKRGFVAASPINRWCAGVGRGSSHHRSECSQLSCAEAHAAPAINWDGVLALDRQLTGIDRSALLRAIASEDGAITHTAVRDHAFAAFAIVRRGRTAAHIGPVVATSAAAAAQVVDSSLADISRCAMADSVLIDIPGDSPLEAIASARGFEIRRRLTRMYRPAVAGALLPRRLPIATIAFELG